MIARRLTVRALVGLGALIGLIVLSAAPVQAAIKHEYLSQITEVPAGSGAGFPGSFLENGMGGLTVDSGELYIADGFLATPVNYRLDKFNASSGAFVSQFPQVPSLAFLHQGVAVGHATGETEVYVAGDETAAGTPEGAVAVFDTAGNLQKVWKGADTPSTAFGCFGCHGSGDVAADNSAALDDWASGNVYVADPEHAVVDVFRPEAKGGEQYRTRLEGISPTEPFATPYRVAVSAFNGDVLVADRRGERSVDIDVFRPSSLENEYEFTGELAGPEGLFEEITAVTADGSNGDIYVANGSVVDEFSSVGTYIGRITGEDTPAGRFNETTSVAVDPDPATHRVYVGDRPVQGGGLVDVFGPNLVISDVTTEEASDIKVGSATLNGTVNPDEAGVATCKFVWGTSTSFGGVLPCSESVAEGNSPVAVSAELTTLQPDTTYHYRLQASNAQGTNPGDASQDREFTTLGAGIHETAASDVTSTSVTLNARIDPNGSPTTYYFQYGTSTAYGSQAPAPPGAPLGAGKGDVEAGVHVQQGISPGTVYHYRVVAVSGIEVSPGVVETQEFDGPDETFTAQLASSGLGLPDGRAWEMVSPPNKEGAQILAIGQYSGEGAVIQAASGGAALTYMTAAPTEPEPRGYENYEQVFSTRGPSGWESKDISIPHDSATGASIGLGEEYRSFSEDLSLGLVQPFGRFMPSLSGEASEQTPYVRTNFVNDDVNSLCTSHCYIPMVTGVSGHANVPSGTTFGEESRCPEANGPGRGGKLEILCGPVFVGATLDLKHVVITSRTALTSTSTDGLEGLYEWSGGNLSLISVLPGGGIASDSALGHGDSNVRHAISGDGTRVVWSGSFESVSGIYMRDVPKGTTVQLDAVQGGSGKGSAEPKFQIASNDGSRVFFTDEQSLTKDSGALVGKPDLYECEMIEEVGELKCKLSDLTPLGSAGSGSAQGVIGASEDGSWVYFVAGSTLYVHHDEVTRTVAVLSAADSPDWETELLSGMTGRVSSDGRWLAFMSQRELTGYDTHDAVTGEPDEEVYLYDAEADGGAGRVVCASCNPAGGRPVGVLDPKDGLALGDRIWGSHRVAANIPGWTPYELLSSVYQSRYLSDSGRLFFNSNDGIVPQDVNGTEDVYQYEPPGVGNCTSSSVSFSVRSGGCVGLISSGSSSEESGFMDASASGGDVFFLTSAKLSDADRDTAVDIYDAHECTVGSPCFAVPPVQPPACDTGDSCKAAPSLQPTIFGSPSSATFSGVGNVIPSVSKPSVRAKGLTRAQKLARALNACKKKSKRRRAACMRQAKARYRAKGSSKANAMKKGRG